MTFDSPKEFLDFLIEGGVPDTAIIDSVIGSLDEGLHLDFKSGKITAKQKRRQGASTVRQYVSAFANSDGGVLVVGVSDAAPRQVDGCIRAGKEPIDKWAEALVSYMTPYLSPLPRFHTVEHPGGSVLVIAVRRAPQLVPCIESNDLRYYLRINQSTVEAPPYLISDLLLGRRRSPVLELTLDEVSCISNRKAPPPNLIFSWAFRIENLSLVSARKVELGLISWSLTPSNMPVAKYLRSHLQIDEIADDPMFGRWALRYKVAPRHRGDRPTIEPFRTTTLSLSASIETPGYEHRHRFSAGMYLMCGDSSPAWYELQYSAELRWIQCHSDLILKECSLQRAAAAPPRVSAMKGTELP